MQLYVPEFIWKIKTKPVYEGKPIGRGPHHLQESILDAQTMH